MSPCTLSVNAFKNPRRDSLFHSRAFFTLHDNGTGRYYEWVDAAGKSVAAIHFTQIEPGLWRSPARGTFAGFDIGDDVTLDSLADFLAAIEADLKSHGAKTIEILPTPEAHDPEKFADLFYLLQSHDYEVSRCDLNFTIDVSATPLQARMRDTQKQRVTKCVRDGFTASELKFSELPAVYDTIAANGAAKGFALSMTMDQIRAMETAIPGSITLFGVRKGDALVSAAICVRLTPKILYKFLVGDQEGYQSYSPVVMMADAIYAWCQKQGITLLDYGTATIGEDPNTGLIEFKRRLGFTGCLKIRMKKTL